MDVDSVSFSNFERSPSFNLSNKHQLTHFLPNGYSFFGMKLKKVKTQKYKAMKMKCRERGRGERVKNRLDRNGERESETYRRDIKEGGKGNE